MAYLSRNERRIEILDAVVRIAGEDGFASASVRRVSQELGIASGNIHHLFASASDLKREAFRRFAEHEVARLDASAQELPPEERLITYLLMPALDTELSTRRLWMSAVEEAARDEEFGQLYSSLTEIWLDRVRQLLILEAGGKLDHDAATKAAWRLMSFSVGVTSFAVAPDLRIGSDDILAHIRTLIGFELALAAGPVRA
ncbi:hypothetical protein PMI01_03834 [Caulobacter sp. AP07]|uniref:TetR family transcriptional regulator n=1 Tax=Caulobacter sp. AP07 TaxID=1144304 RepID=UPI0002720C6C|nr:TetR family transcriptional regulator C-terminal domain-containing protein [Caulobacter sp. AP07]EJL27353.1 hypothetical protein PMI01_03834 [Caulobacter sp. AP07]